MSQTFLEKVLELSALSGEHSFEDHFFSAVKGEINVTIGSAFKATINRKLNGKIERKIKGTIK